MDGPHLSPGERSLLAAIERGLSDDRRLERRLRTMRTGRARHERPRLLPLATLGLALVSATLMALGVLSSSIPLIGAFAVAWTATVVCGACWLRRIWRTAGGS
ncbi:MULTISPECIES: DUF3040 domain-containing protein [unclassified Streptomyces]|uniref:DUF3040 domain-containing protein n=1 Tax=unclassified Streptomyces TaxID=2593676 RepID=UPI0037239D19